MSLGTKHRVWLLALALASWGMGCKSPDMPADPMFISRKPVEAKQETAAPTAVVYAEPVLPPDPVLIVAAPPASPSEVAQPSNKPSGKPPRKIPGILTNQPAPENDGPLLQVIPPTLPPKPQPE
jgi:hypothetical protein